MVEALTIVLALGITRGWRSTLIGAGVAALALAAVVGVLGPAVTLVPIDVLRLTVGTLLLVFGLQWLRKAILRAGGLKAQHDEEAIFAHERDEALRAGPGKRAGLDWYAFTLSFKGVFLEGLEVAFIVVTLGSAHSGGTALAATAAGSAVVLVALAGALVRAPLSRIPENALKLSVGVMLTSYGMFWGAEGAGADWPGGDAALVGLLAFTLLVTYGLVRMLRRPVVPPPVPVAVER
jgi:uncharacterized membrane protein